MRRHLGGVASRIALDGRSRVRYRHARTRPILRRFLGLSCGRPDSSNLPSTKRFS